MGIGETGGRDGNRLAAGTGTVVGSWTGGDRRTERRQEDRRKAGEQEGGRWKGRRQGSEKK